MHVRVALLAILAPQTLIAADLDLASRVDRVTVYPDAALVTRRGTADLPAGATTLILRGLPASLDPASLRVEGQGDGALTIGAVDVRLTPGDARPALDPELERRIVKLRDERDAAAARLAALDTKRAAIERFAQASPEKLGVEGKPFEVSQWQGAWDAVGAGLASVHEDLRQARARQRDLDAELVALERAQPAAGRPGAPKRDVAIAIETSGPVKGELRVSYRVVGASWTPLYDARLDTGAQDRKASLELARRAQVTQRTGEDWSDVELAVSTVRVNRGTAAPDLPPIQVSFYEPAIAARPATPVAPAPLAEAQRDRGFRFTGGTNFGPTEPSSKVDASQQGATLEAGAFQATFRVPGRVAVGQDGLSKTFVLGTSQARPALAVSAAPELDETAYLKASFKHEEEAPLLPGEVSLHRDGTFVGRGRIRLTASGDTVDLGFGADDRVKITRVPLRRQERETWTGSNKTDLREFKTSVRNLHSQPIRITVTDRLPFSENSAITVEQLRDTTPPTEKTPNDKRGVIAWTYDYAPGEQKEIRLGYRLRWPAERELVLEPRPNGALPRS